MYFPGTCFWNGFGEEGWLGSDDACEHIVDLRYFILSAWKKVLWYESNPDPKEKQPPKRKVYVNI